MAAYDVRILPDALHQLHHLPKHVRANISQRIDALSSDPRPQQGIPLKGARGAWRLRVGDYRVLYRIDDGVMTVTVSDIKHRREAYR